MRYVLPWSGDWAGCPVSRDRAADRQSCAVLPAAVAGRAGPDCGGHIPISTVTGGLHDDEGGCLEKPEIPAWDPVQAISHYMSEAEAVLPLLFSYYPTGGHIVIQEQQ